MRDAIAALHRLRKAGFDGLTEGHQDGVVVCRRWWTSSNAVDVLLVYDHDDAEAFRVAEIDPLHPTTSAARLCWRDRGPVPAMVGVVLNQHAPNERAVPLTMRHRTDEARHEERVVLLATSLPERHPGQHMRTLLSGDLAQPRTAMCRAPDQNLMARVLEGLHALADENAAPTAEHTTQQEV